MQEDQPRYLETNISEEELKKEHTKKVKLDNKKSRFSTKVNNKEEFEQKVISTNKKMQSHLVEAFELGKQYKDLLDNKTITDNKTFLAESKEKEIIGKLINYAVKINTDQNELEGMGSVALITLLLKCVIKMRDRYNDIEYKYHLLERNHIKLEEKFNKLSSRVSSGDSK